MIFLRAYARVLRVEEELVHVPLEMQRTLASYKTHREGWKTRGRDTSLGAGGEAWAARQAAFWHSLHGHAEAVFSAARMQAGLL